MALTLTCMPGILTLTLTLTCMPGIHGPDPDLHARDPSQLLRATNYRRYEGLMAFLSDLWLFMVTYGYISREAYASS